MSSQEYDKDRTVQQKSRKAILPKIAYPTNMDTLEAEFSYYTSPIEKEEGVKYRKDHKSKKYDEDKDPEFPDETSIVEMEGG